LRGLQEPRCGVFLANRINVAVADGRDFQPTGQARRQAKGARHKSDLAVPKAVPSGAGQAEAKTGIRHMRGLQRGPSDARLMAPASA